MRAGLVTGLAGVVVLALAFGFWHARSHLLAPPPGCHGDGWLAAGPECLRIETYRSADVTASPRLVVAIHGDSPTAPPSYQYRWAKTVAAENTNVVVVGLLRPGYLDGTAYSTGERGKTTGDNYTPRVIDAIAAGIARLAQDHHARQVLMAGHSGGAAIAADVLSLHPAVADAAVLVSCPCDVARWREHMYKTRGGEVWREAITSISPRDVTGGIDSRARITIVVGDRDDVVPPDIGVQYYEQLRTRGVDATLIHVPGGGHDIFLEPAVRDAVRQWLQ